MQIIHSIKDNCKLCYACIRACPSNAMKVVDNHVEVLNDRCTVCGACVRVCPHDALGYSDGVGVVENLIKSSSEVVAIVAPSVSGEFSDISNHRSFVGMIKALGFSRVCEVSFGSDLVALKYRDLFDNFKGKYFISSNCPAVVNFVERFHPNLIDNMAPIVSPMVATAKVVRRQYGENIKVVYIGPCTAAKYEATHTSGDSLVDVVLTFEELRKLFKLHTIKEANVEYSDFDPPIGGKGSLFPISRGMFQSVGINENLLTGRLIATDGKFNVLDALTEFEQYNELKQHLDLFYCDGSCIMGPGTSKGGKKFLRRSMVINYTKRRLKSRDVGEWEANIKKFADIDLSRTFHNLDQTIPEPSKEKVDKILNIIGKTDEDKHSGCGACGYESCVEFSKSVVLGLANLDMCHTYAIQNKQNIIKRMKVTNEKLTNIQNELKRSEQIALVERQKYDEMTKTTKEMLNKLKAGVVIVDSTGKIILANHGFINFLGEDAKEIADVVPGLTGASIETLVPPYVKNYFYYVIENDHLIENKDIHLNDKLLNVSVFPIEKNKIAGAIFRDMYVPEVQREEVVSRIDEVIESNLNMVQKIGFLLGEGASETERMLNSIIQSYQKNKQK